MESFYDSKTKKIKYANVRTIGYVHLYKDQYDDPLAYFRSEVERLNAEAAIKKAAKNEEYTVHLNADARNSDDNREGAAYVIGHAPIMHIYNSLNLDEFFKAHSKKFKCEFPLWSIFKNEVISRILKPSSKMESYNNRRLYYDNIKQSNDRFDYELYDVYRELGKLRLLDEKLQTFLYENTKQYLRNMTLVHVIIILLIIILR
jgi:uncharacterized small protein (DUF1192 family)